MCSINNENNSVLVIYVEFGMVLNLMINVIIGDIKMTKLPEIIILTPAAKTESVVEVKCLYCGSQNCGSLFGDPVCHELPTAK